jgi:hypothetical protein
MYVYIVVIIVAILLLGVCLFHRREGFTLHERDGILWPPFLNNRDAYLMPNSVVFVIQGYNYETTPKIFRDGELVTPLQYAWDYANMAYYLTIYAPHGLCDSEWMLETSDFVEPVVFEGRSQRKMNVSLERRRAGYHHWMLTC